MKIYRLISLLSAVFLLTACPESQYQSDLSKIQENDMDLPELHNSYFQGVSFLLSDLFASDYEDSYVLSDVAETYAIYDIGVKFSVERFSQDEGDVLRYAFEEEIDALNAVHDNHVLKRQASLFHQKTSIKKELPKSVLYPGYIQVIHGDAYDDELGVSYFCATMKIDGYYFVFQMIGKRENMGYLYDDFLAILESVRS